MSASAAAHGLSSVMYKTWGRIRNENKILKLCLSEHLLMSAGVELVSMGHQEAGLDEGRTTTRTRPQRCLPCAAPPSPPRDQEHE